MGTRCAIVGRERAVSPSKLAYDDGAIAMATLFAFGAEKIRPGHRLAKNDTGPEGSVGGHVGEQSDSPPHASAAPTSSSADLCNSLQANSQDMP